MYQVPAPDGLNNLTLKNFDKFYKKNPPFTAIVDVPNTIGGKISDILNRPIGREPTPDNIAAFNVAMVLAQQGKLGNFFTENNKKNRALWSIAIRKFNSGNQQPEDILKELGRYTANYKFATLNTDDKNALKSLANSKDVEYNQRNRAIYNDIASWYKSISPEDEWEANTKQYIEDHYEVYNGNLYSKNKIISTIVILF